MAGVSKEVMAILHRRGVEPLGHADQLVPDVWMMLLEQLPDQPMRSENDLGSDRSTPEATDLS